MSSLHKYEEEIDKVLSQYDTWCRCYQVECQRASNYKDAKDELLAFLQKVEIEANKIDGETSDGYHTFNELYDYRRVYNAALFNEWATRGKYSVHKSWRHSDGELAFGGDWFIVVAQLPTGQISNHYEAKYWDDFRVPEAELPLTYDGHTPQEALDRLAALRNQTGEENNG